MIINETPSYFKTKYFLDYAKTDNFFIDDYMNICNQIILKVNESHYTSLPYPSVLPFPINHTVAQLFFVRFYIDLDSVACSQSKELVNAQQLEERINAIAEDTFLLVEPIEEIRGVFYSIKESKRPVRLFYKADASPELKEIVESALLNINSKINHF